MSHQISAISEKAIRENRAALSKRGELGELILQHVQVENAHDMRGTLATLHKDCVFEDVPTGRKFYGRQGAEEYYREWWTAFGLVVVPREDGRLHWADDGTHIAESRFFGKHVGPFLQIPATSREVEFRFAVFVNFKDGLMLGERFYYDLASIFKQIGVTELPPGFQAFK